MTHARGPHREPATPMRWAVGRAALMMALGLVAGCGGGSPSGDDPGAGGPLATAIAATPLQYAEEVQIEVTGERLDNQVSIRLSGACEGVPTLVRTGETKLTTRCTPTAVGPLSIAVTAGSAELKSDVFTVPPPRIAIAVGSASTATTFTFELDPGATGSSQRGWTDLFLRRARLGEYTGTVFHQILGGSRLEAGCYVVNGNNVPSARSLSPPVVAVVQQLGQSNTQYSLAMSKERCRDSQGVDQPGIFAVNLADNSSSAGQLTPVDRLNYVVIGELVGNSEKQALQDLSNVATANYSYLSDFPKDPQSVTLRSLIRVQ